MLMSYQPILYARNGVSSGEFADHAEQNATRWQSSVRMELMPQPLKTRSDAERGGNYRGMACPSGEMVSAGALISQRAASSCYSYRPNLIGLMATMLAIGHTGTQLSRKTTFNFINAGINQADMTFIGHEHRHKEALALIKDNLSSFRPQSS